MQSKNEILDQGLILKTTLYKVVHRQTLHLDTRVAYTVFHLFYCLEFQTYAMPLGTNFHYLH
jgi:hypothetical protein